MSALGFLAVSSMLAGGLPPLRWRRKRGRKPDPVAQDRAAAKRARKAVKRAEDARRTAEGRVTCIEPHFVPRGIWDRVEMYIRHGGSGAVEIRWRRRLNHRRSLPMHVSASCGWSRAQARRRIAASLRFIRRQR